MFEINTKNTTAECTHTTFTHTHITFTHTKISQPSHNFVASILLIKGYIKISEAGKLQGAVFNENICTVTDRTVSGYGG